MKYVLNSVPLESTQNSISYSRIIDLCFGPTVTEGYSITYYDPRSKRRGVLAKGGRIKLSEGMIINCVLTNNA